ncbi:MAG: DUF1007 family protein [Alphaproteobacteria bacterium]
MYKKRVLFCVFLLNLFLIKEAESHPHVWADVQIIAKFDASQKVKEISQIWAFDEMFSELILIDYDKDKNKVLSKKEVLDIKEKAFKHLKSEGFYTHIFVNGKKYDQYTLSKFHAEIKNGEVIYQFTLLLNTQLDPFSDKISLGVYDPQFYTELTYKRDKSFKAKGIALSECPYKITEDNEHPIYFDMVSPQKIDLCQ